MSNHEIVESTKSYFEATKQTGQSEPNNNFSGIKVFQLASVNIPNFFHHTFIDETFQGMKIGICEEKRKRNW